MPKSGAKDKLRRTGHSGSWPVTYRWAALGTLVVYTAVGTRTIPLVRAQELPAGRAGLGDGANPTLPVRRFAIRPGPLRDVLTEWECLVGMHVHAEKEGILDLQSRGI